MFHDVNDSGLGCDKTFHCSDEEDVLKPASLNESLVTSFQIFLVDATARDPDVVRICQTFNVPISFVEKIPTESPDNILSVYVVNTFDNVQNNGTNTRVISRNALLEVTSKEESRRNYGSLFSSLAKPLYCYALSGQVICFTGFKDRDELIRMKSLINFMGGRVRKEMNSETTHLVAKICKGEKYSYAMLFSVPVVSENWIYDAWKNRNTIGFDAADDNYMSKYKLKLFHGSKISFLGFAEEEKSHMVEVLQENGGEPVDITDNTCTHLVVDDVRISSVPPLKCNKTFVVKAEWFWSSIQYECRKNELDFKLDSSYQMSNSNLNDTPLLNTSSSSHFCTSNNRTRKRKILKEKYSIAAESPQSAQKRRSSVSDSTKLSEGSFLDFTFSSPVTADGNESTISSGKLRTSKRYLKFMELCQTETNYVGILKTIMTIFKAALEAMVDKKEQLLNATELKIIFGHLPPIYETHCRMLEDLNQLAVKWNEDSSIGNVILKYSDDLVKAYPPFINFFENTRDMLTKCDRTKPRFHAFLKLRQSKPECGRQSLQDLLIRPVQRLPSVNLLLNDILRSTPKSNIDHDKLEAAIDEIQKVVTYINEDKKRTEGQVALFDIFNDIENCPADLVSSHRCFLSRCEVILRSGDISVKGKPLVFFLFSDVIEVCKKKVKSSSKENNLTASSKHGNAKVYKHLSVIRLADIVKVIDIKETEDCSNSFALVVKKELPKEAGNILSFIITDAYVNKSKYLRSLCSQIANISCTPDIDSYLTEIEAQRLEADAGETNAGAFSKALTIASETRKKVSRAFSFTKTPNKLKRAMSTMMSPFGSQNSSTPSSKFANLHLAALPPASSYEERNLTNTPTSVHAVRKNKSSSFSMGSLRRL